MLWLALHLPSLSLESFCATLPREGLATGSAAPAVAVALVAEHRITEFNAAAAARGLRAGMKRATALALAADLLLAEADPARDAAALRAVAHAALAFTPSVALQGGQATVLMEVSASLRLFGGMAALHRRLLEVLAPLGHRVQVAAAPTALGAAMLARWGRQASTAPAMENLKATAGAESGPRAEARRSATADFDPVLGPHATRLPELVRLLDRAPVWLLGPGREHWEALQGMGLRTLADLRGLPRAGLARRFGEALLQDLDRALGQAPDPLRWLELPTRFETRLELHQRADTTEQVLAAAAVLLARLVVWAQARHGRIAAFTLAMQHEPRHQGRGGAVPATELRIELAEPALEAAHLQLLLRERLARVALAAPTLELRLRCRELASGAPPNGELFPTRSSEALGLARLLERLRARLGDAQVQRLEPVADHRPERSSRGVPALAAVAVSRARATAKAAPELKRKGPRVVPGPKSQGPALPAQQALAGPEPTQQHPQPHEDRAAASLRPPPREDRALPLHRPSQHEARALLLHRPVWLLPEPVPLPERNALPLLDGQPLQLVSGPERIEAGWWDGEPAARDYFIGLAADGSLVWVWRHRLPSAPRDNADGVQDVQWMLQGRFA